MTDTNTSGADVLAKPRMKPEDNKFHVGNGSDGKHYWLTPPQLLAELSAKHGPFDFDPCPFPKPEGFDGLTCEWGSNSYCNPPFGSVMHEGKKKGPTAWARKAIAEAAKGKRVTLVYPIDKWVLMLLAAGAKVTNLGDVRWLATEDGTAGKGTGRHIACFVLGSDDPEPSAVAALIEREAVLIADRDAARRERDEEAEERENAESKLADLANRMVYQGNSVAYIASKAKNYGDALLEAWAALNDGGYRRPAGEMPNLTEAIKQHCDALAAEVKALREGAERAPHNAAIPEAKKELGGFDNWERDHYSRGWNACRDAMLAASAATGGGNG